MILVGRYCGGRFVPTGQGLRVAPIQHISCITFGQICNKLIPVSVRRYGLAPGLIHTCSYKSTYFFKNSNFASPNHILSYKTIIRKPFFRNSEKYPVLISMIFMADFFIVSAKRFSYPTSLALVSLTS